MAIPLRVDFDADAVRSWAKRSKDGPQARRLLALAAIYEGASRTEAAKIGGVTLQIVRDCGFCASTRSGQKVSWTARRRGSRRSSTMNSAPL